MGTTEQRQGLDRELVEELASRFQAAWESRDPQRLAALCTDDVVWVDPASPAPLHGHAGVVRFASASFRMTSDFELEWTEPPYVSATEPRALLPYRMRGTMDGPWELNDLAPTGRRFEIEGIDAWEVRDGLIARYRSFFDAADASRQMGVLPDNGSHAETLMTRLQHVQARLQRRSARR